MGYTYRLEAGHSTTHFSDSVSGAMVRWSKSGLCTSTRMGPQITVLVTVIPYYVVLFLGKTYCINSICSCVYFILNFSIAFFIFCFSRGPLLRHPQGSPFRLILELSAALLSLYQM